jgi:uncharacterized membrane protein YeiB
LRGKPGEAGFPAAMIVPGGLILLAALVQALGDAGSDTGMLAFGGTVMVALGLLAQRWGGAGDARLWRAGVAIYVLTFGLMAAEGGLRYLAPHAAPLTSAAATSADGKQVDDDTARLLRHRERLDRSVEETRVLTKGSHADAMAMRARYLGQRLRDEAGFAILLVAVFLIGAWCVKSGVAANPGAHRSLLRRLALIGIPLGVGLGLAGSLIATGRPAGVDDQGYDFANALLMLGSLPASLGYMAAVLLMLQRYSGLSRLLAPFGRMALTNYLMQSLVLSLLFYGYGAGLWGMGRAGQTGVALALCVLQMLMSRWWLRRFQYGPLEWLWRALTYLELPAWRTSQMAPAKA